MYIPKTIIVVASLTGLAFTAGIGSHFLSSTDTSAIDKKHALEANQFSSKQLPSGAQCYDLVLAGLPQSSAMDAAATCKCLISEADKYAPSLRPALTRLLFIGLSATIETSNISARNAYIQSEVSKDQILNATVESQHAVLQSGIVHITKSCNRAVPAGE